MLHVFTSFNFIFQTADWFLLFSCHLTWLGMHATWMTSVFVCIPFNSFCFRAINVQGTQLMNDCWLTNWLTNKQLVRRMVYWIKLMNGINVWMNGMNDFIDWWNISIVSLFETVAIIAKWMSKQRCSSTNGFCDGMCLQLLPLNEDNNCKGNEQ